MSTPLRYSFGIKNVSPSQGSDMLFNQRKFKTQQEENIDILLVNLPWVCLDPNMTFNSLLLCSAPKAPNGSNWAKLVCLMLRVNGACFLTLKFVMSRGAH